MQKNLDEKKFKIVIAPDSFKGTMSSAEVCGIIRRAVLKAMPNADITTVAIADGGEGSIDAILQSAAGKKVFCEVTNPDFEKVFAYYAMLDNGKTAVIETAQCAGLTLSKLKNPELTTTYGIGELICDALSKGVENIFLALGGSSTNDCGTGMAAALGARFFDNNGNVFIPTGGTLQRVQSFDLAPLKRRMSGITVKAMCDVKNPLYGENGAAYVYAPQKGADNSQVKTLDSGLRHIAGIIQNELGTDVNTLPGAGAAGGLGAAAVAFFGGTLVSGIDAVLDICGFDQLAANADFIITGEGSFDTQSLMGKVVQGISLKKPEKAKLIVIAGRNSVPESVYLNAGIFKVFQTSAGNNSFDEIKRTCREDLFNTVFNIFSSEYVL